jgi:hypothetical protein
VESVGAPAFLTVSGSELTTTHQVTVANLTAGTTYSYKVTSADFAGNSSSVPFVGSLTFTTLSASFVDTTVADFSQGSPNSTSVTAIGDGAVSLSASAGVVNWGAGPGLPAGWQSASWEVAPAGTVTVDSGALSVSGARVISDATFPRGQSFNAVATFSSNPFQHVGFAENLAGEGAWALFSTRGTNNTLFASTLVGSSLIDVPLVVDFVNTPHTYRIDWTVSGVVFSIDGTVVSSQTTAISTPMSASTPRVRP